MELLQSKFAKWLIFGALVGGATMCGRSPEVQVSESPSSADSAEIEQVSEAVEDSSNSTQLVSDSQPVTPVLPQSYLVDDPEICPQTSRCLREWALQVMGSQVQTRADELFNMARQSSNADEWLAKQLEHNRALLEASALPIGNVYGGDAAQNSVIFGHGQEIAAIATAQLMLEESKLPTGRGTNVSKLLTFAQSAVYEAIARNPSMAADTTDQLREAMPQLETVIRVASEDNGNE